MKILRLPSFILMMVVVLSACGGNIELKEEQLFISETPHTGINESITPVSSTQINIDGVLVSIVGIDYGKNIKVVRENDWKSSDDRGVAASFFGGMGEGFAKGISSSESKDKDGTLIVYLEMQLVEEQRPKVADVPIRITDNEGASSKIELSSYTYGPMSPGEKYLEYAEFKVFSDAEFFSIQIGDEHKFKVEAPEFKQ